MCDPTGVSYAGLAVAVASAAASAAAQQHSQQVAADQRSKAARQEQQRQQQYRDRARQVLDQSVSEQALPNQDSGLAATQEDRQTKIADAVKPTTGDYAPSTGSTPTIVQTEVARKLNQALSKGKATAANLAALGTFGDQQFKNRLALNDSNSNLNMLAGFSQGSAGVLPYELNNANQQGQGWKTFGDILGGTGQAVGNAAMTGAFDSWFQGSPYGAVGRFGGGRVPIGLDGRIAGGV